MPRPRRAFDMLPLNIARHPPTVEIPRLWLHLLAINIAVPRPRVEAQVSLDIFEARCRVLVRPDPTLDDLAWVAWIRGIEVRRAAFPLTEGGVAVLGERDGHG